MIHVLYPDKAPSVYTLPPNQEASLELLYALIGTDTIEVPLDDGVYQFVCDENGKLKNSLPNIRATAFWYAELGFQDAANRFLLTNETLSDVLVGTVVILTKGNRLT